MRVVSGVDCDDLSGFSRPAGTMAAMSDDATLRSEAENLRRRLKEVEAAGEEVQSRLAFLATASGALAGSLNVGATLVTLGNLAVPRLADWCVVHLLDED